MCVDKGVGAPFNELLTPNNAEDDGAKNGEGVPKTGAADALTPNAEEAMVCEFPNGAGVREVNDGIPVAVPENGRDSCCWPRLDGTKAGRTGASPSGVEPVQVRR